MVLVLLTNAGQVADDGDTELVEKLSIADTRALEDLQFISSVPRPAETVESTDLRGAECTGANDDHLARLDDGLLDLCAMCAVARRDVCDTDGLVVRIEEDARDPRIAAEVEVALNIHDGVDIGCREDMLTNPHGHSIQYTYQWQRHYVCRYAC